MLSFALGLLDLTNERVGQVLAACSAAAPPVALEPTTADTPISLRHAALGLLSDAASRLAGRRAPLARARKLVNRLPGLPRAFGRLGTWRDRGRHRLARWSDIGRREQAQSRILAFDALTVLRENILARVSESPDVKSVIREQSTGMAVTAIDGLRQESARADSLVERTVGRLLHDGHTPRRR
jgi:hypothetical protein